MENREYIIWQTQQEILDSKLRVIELAGEELVRRGANPFIVNEIVYQEKIKTVAQDIFSREL